MIPHSEDFGPQSFLVSTVIPFGDREFEVVVMHDGVSYWLDPAAKHRELENDPHFVLKARLGSETARRKLVQIQEEYTISAPVPEEGLQIIREELSPAYWAAEMDEGFDERLDAILIPVFWEHVNRFLETPIERRP